VLTTVLKALSMQKDNFFLGGGGGGDVPSIETKHHSTVHVCEK